MKATTQVLTASGPIENNIPRAQYKRHGEIQWMSLPNDIKGELVMQGTDNGTFDLEVRNELNGQILQNTTFVDIPVLTTTDVTMNIDSSDITKAGDMIVDVKGDNTELFNLEPKIGEEVVFHNILTVTPDNQTVILHGTIPTLSYTISGYATNTSNVLINDVTGAPVCTTNASSLSNIGKYEISCTKGTMSSSLYDFNFATNTMSIIYKFSGLQNPVIANTVYKQGRTLPIKFQLLDANNIPQQSQESIYWLNPIKGESISNTPIIDINTTSSTTSSTFKFENADSGYHYNWDTRSVQSGYWYSLPIELSDGKIYKTVTGLK